MGRRSRSRTRTAPGADPAARRAKAAPAAPAARAARPARERAFDRLPPVRRALTRYLVAALAISVTTMAGIAGLGGTLGPWIVFAFAVTSAGVTFRWAQRELTGQTMGDDDRMMQTMAGGMLLLSVALAAVGAIVLTLA